MNGTEDASIPDDNSASADDGETCPRRAAPDVFALAAQDVTAHPGDMITITGFVAGEDLIGLCLLQRGGGAVGPDPGEILQTQVVTDAGVTLSLPSGVTLLVQGVAVPLTEDDLAILEMDWI